MEWLTEAEIRAAAERGKKPAIRISSKHWWQMATATEEEFSDGLDNDKTGVGERYCALCQRYGKCKKCILKNPQDHSHEVCCKTYRKAEKAGRRWREGVGRHSTFQRRATDMYELLESLL